MKNDGCFDFSLLYFKGHFLGLFSELFFNRLDKGEKKHGFVTTYDLIIN